MSSLICNFSLGVPVRTMVWANTPLGYASANPTPTVVPTVLRAVTLRQMLQIKLSTSPDHSTPTPLPALTLQRQAPGREGTRAPLLKSLM